MKSKRITLTSYDVDPNSCKPAEHLEPVVQCTHVSERLSLVDIGVCYWHTDSCRDQGGREWIFDTQGAA